MSLSCGIVGLPNAGKSTLFKALTSIPVLIKDYPFSTIKPNVGLVPINDECLEPLSRVTMPEKVTPSYLKVVDVAGLVKGAHKGEGLGNRFLATLREVDLLVHVIADYEKPVNNNAAELNERADTVNYELLLSDISVIENRITMIEKKAKSGEKVFVEELRVLNKAFNHLNTSGFIKMMEKDSREELFLGELNLLTQKHMIYILNRNETNIAEQIPREILKYAGMQKATVNCICTKLEAELQELNEEERELFKAEFSLEKSALTNIIEVCRNMLQLITFYTIKGTETRAWLVGNNTTALEAAGRVHTDMQKGFIAAEVIPCSILLKEGSVQAAREKGLLRIEGKNYIVREGDVMYFRFSG